MQKHAFECLRIALELREVQNFDSLVMNNLKKSEEF